MGVSCNRLLDGGLLTARPMQVTMGRNRFGEELDDCRKELEQDLATCFGLDRRANVTAGFVLVPEKDWPGWRLSLDFVPEVARELFERRQICAGEDRVV